MTTITMTPLIQRSGRQIYLQTIKNNIQYLHLKCNRNVFFYIQSIINHECFNPTPLKSSSIQRHRQHWANKTHDSTNKTDSFNKTEILLKVTLIFDAIKYQFYQLYSRKRYMLVSRLIYNLELSNNWKANKTSLRASKPQGVNRIS